MPDEPAPTVQSTARHVAQIVAAAEQAAEDLRTVAEERANERIAEAERAAQLRVQAADAEAEQVRAEAASEADELRREAAARAAEERDLAHARARELVAEARAATRDVLREGEQLSGHLRELADALRINAERLLRDVREAHGALNARLDAVDRDRRPAPPVRRRSEPAPPDLDVPEFIPRHS
jgi:chromosome segregation ATPase